MKNAKQVANAATFNGSDDFEYIEPQVRQIDEIKDALRTLSILNWYSVHKGIQMQIEDEDIQVVDDPSLPIDLVVNGEVIRKDVWDDISTRLDYVEKTFETDHFGSRSDFEWGMDIGKLFGLRWVIGEEWADDLLLLDSSDECDLAEYNLPCGNSNSFALIPETVTKVRSEFMVRENVEKLTDQVWYNRHMVLREKIEDGIIKIVEADNYQFSKHDVTICRDTLKGALRAAKDVEDLYGIDSLGPWTDLEWGIVNGKLSALRWVLGDEWDQLDT